MAAFLTGRGPMSEGHLRLKLALTVGVVISISACQAGVQTQSGDSVGMAPEVSKQEYDAAFEEFRTCVVEAGGELLDVSVNTQFGTYEYLYRDADFRIVEDCYIEHFREAQIGYESHNEAMQEADAQETKMDWEQNVLPCLRDQGFDDVPTDFEAVMQLPGDEMRELHRTATELMLAGSCDVTFGD